MEELTATKILQLLYLYTLFVVILLCHKCFRSVERKSKLGILLRSSIYDSSRVEMDIFLTLSPSTPKSIIVYKVCHRQVK